MTFEYIITKKTDIKSFLLEENFSLNVINKLLLEKKNIFINNATYNGNFLLQENDRLKVVLIDSKSSVECVNKPIKILFEDDYFLVVFKEKNLAVIPSKLHYEDSLAGRVANYYKESEQNIGIHIINRLDLLTSGIVVFAKSNYVQNIMSKVKIDKHYFAIVSGILENKTGTITAKIGRTGNSIKRQVLESGKESLTEYKVIKEIDKNTLVDIHLLTGRTHQIRVHFAYINHPLVDDPMYNENKKTSNGEYFYLQAYKLCFNFPINKKEYNFEIENNL